MKKIELDESILDIIERYTEKAPVDVRGLAKELGLSIEEKQMEDDISGSIEKMNAQYKITVNDAHSENRKRFTIAHELGHFMLHDRLINNGIYDDKLYRSYENRRNKNVNDFHETEANVFAANLLMPADLVYKLINEKNLNCAQLAENLQVSKQAMEIRLESLSKSFGKYSAFRKNAA